MAGLRSRSRPADCTFSSAEADRAARDPAAKSPAVASASPPAALGHYQAPGFAPPATPVNEVWLDVTVEAGGVARSEAAVPFQIAAGERSVVIHALATAPGGAAGARLACLPVRF